ncbi:MAG: hypothetical protein II315_05235 [Rikenellaceae bacterium]|nr:hypothetical protein [Rikenellaceae bacterium]
MKKQEITIAQHQRLSDVLTEIPTNVILNKTITGCGATHSEIHAKRNSIIIEPNLPVIDGKCAKHPDIFGVKEGVTKEDIVAYLQSNPDCGYHKILTTPESFPKVRSALYDANLRMYDDWFLLFDECERTIQDAGFRGTITLPMDDFFRCRNKAMVSATPIVPSDPRFAEQKFRQLILSPSYDYKRPIKLIHTNNMVGWLATFINDSLEMELPCCIFVNSAELIYQLIKTLRIENRSKVFCSADSVKRLRTLGFDNAHTLLEELAKINFFTSRFYSAVDIDCATKVGVIMLSDPRFADYTMIDPLTEAVQIVGRFRNGVEDVAHIFYTDPCLTYKTQEQLAEELESCEEVYKTVSAIATTTARAQENKQEALRGMDYHRFMREDGQRNYFMWDNAYDDERIKLYYTDPLLLKTAYERTFCVEFYKYIYPDKECVRLIRPVQKIDSRDLFRGVVKQLEQYEDGLPIEYILATLTSQLHLMIDAYYALGKDKIEARGYRLDKFKEDLRENECQMLLSCDAMKEHIYSRLKVGETVSVKEVRSILTQAIDHFGIPYKKEVSSRLLKHFFKFEKRRTKHERLIRITHKI